MKKRESDSHSAVSRREFLSLAGCGALAVLAVGPASQFAEAEAVQPVAAGTAARSADTGPISAEYFEAARKRAAAIISKMTLKEKVSQFGNRAPAIPRLNLPAFNFYASEALHGLIHPGPVTSFPLPLAMGCSWDPALVHRVFTAVSDEIWAWHKKNGQGLAMFSPPTVNMGNRDPRWGRVAENYSEDPFLVGQLAIEAIRGIQGDNPQYLKSIACAKHFIANATDDDREETSATVDPRSFWEYYSRSFEICVTEGKVFTVMSSYNEMNGIPTTANPFLLTELLRDRWGFRGYVVSDCDAVGDITRTHHFVPTYAEAAALAVNAGCDINCGNTLPRFLGQAVNEMLISEETIDHSLTRSLAGRILLGDLDPQDESPYHTIPVSCLESPEHRALCRQIGQESVVLFKNEANTLPLAADYAGKLAVIGPMAGVCHLGNYSGKPLHLVSPLDGILGHFGIQPSTPIVAPVPKMMKIPGTVDWVNTFEGYTYAGPPSRVFTNGKAQVTFAVGCAVSGPKDEKLFDAAVEAAKGADTVLVFVGDDQQIDREAHDRSFLHLPGVQHELVKAVFAANPKTILVLSTNCPVAVNWEAEHLPAIVGGMFLGEEQGHALADVLFGAYNPGGKLSTTWYRDTASLPSFHSYNIRYGRTYQYFEGVPLFPFGHGLSYTKFAYSGLQLTSGSLAPGGIITAKLRVANTGHHDGDEVVQFYVHVSGGTMQRPIKQLVGFKRVHLTAGEAKAVQFQLPYSDKALRYWDDAKQEFVLDPGTVDILIGSSSADIRLRGHVSLEA